MERFFPMTTRVADLEALDTRLCGLLERCAGGDLAAMGELVDLTSPALHCVARCVTGDDRRADEVLVKIYVEMWRRVTSGASVGRAPALDLLAMARSRALAA